MITPIGPVPSPLDSQAAFNTKAFNLLAQLPGFAEETNATAADMQTNADVAAALITAMALPQFMGTSTSSLAIGTGAKSFATQTGKEWVVGQVVIASSGSNYMKGAVAAYNSGTGVLDVLVASVNGSGTFVSWTIGLSYDGLSLAGAGDNTNILKLLGLTDVPAVVQAAIDAAVPAGKLCTFARTTGPAGYLVCPTAATNVSRTTYAALFAAIGTTWGAGDGSTTFGIPWFPADYTLSQASSNVGTQTVGQLLTHTHGVPNNAGSGGTFGYGLTAGGSAAQVSSGMTPAGGAGNLAAGSRVLICVKY